MGERRMVQLVSKDKADPVLGRGGGGEREREKGGGGGGGGGDI